MGTGAVCWQKYRVESQEAGEQGPWESRRAPDTWKSMILSPLIHFQTIKYEFTQTLGVGKKKK